MKPSDNRNARPFFWKNAGHCTRCEGPFRGNTAFIVDEKIAWATHMAGTAYATAFTQIEKVPVCTDCVDIAEEARAAERKTVKVCPGCGLSLKIGTRIYWLGKYCSERCEQRDRRRRRAAARRRQLKICAGCGTSFSGRAGAKTCCAACRQAAYRRRVGTIPAIVAHETGAQ